MRRSLTIFPVLLASLALAGAVPDEDPWRVLDEGLWLREFNAPKAKAPITVLKISPRSYDFRLLDAAELHEARMTAKEWSRKYHLAAAVNAGMYGNDGSTSVGYMKNFDHFNNRRMNRGMKAVLAFNAKDASVPPIQIIDRKCHDLDSLRHKYHTLIQGIRMIGCLRTNVWNKQDAAWSMAVFATDRAGDALIIFTQAPHTPRDFIEILLALPLSIQSAMYLEGGSEASFYVAAGPGPEIEKFGTHGTGFLGLFQNQASWRIPNVIGITRKAPAAPAPAR